MDRKDFLSAIAPLAAVASAITTSNKTNEDDSLKIPGYLKQGDKIGITSPSGYIKHEEIQPAVSKLKEWGFDVSVGSSIGKRDFS